MCDVDADLCPVWKEHDRTARKPHTCLGCRETIRPQDSYRETRSLYDGSWSTMKHCRRCDALFKALAEQTRDAYGYHVVAIDPTFGCGETWQGNFGLVPPEVQALAFMLPGEPVPVREDFQPLTPNPPDR